MKRLNFWNFVATHAFWSGWHLFAVLTIAPFLRTQSIMLGFWFNLVTSILVTFVNWFNGHRFKLKAEDFIFYILQINFPNFSMKRLVLYSAKSLQSFDFSLFCFQLVYTCSKFGLKNLKTDIFCSFPVLKWHIIVQTNRNNKLLFKDEHS